MRGHSSLTSLARTESNSMMSVLQDVDDFDSYSTATRKNQFECSFDLGSLE